METTRIISQAQLVTVHCQQVVDKKVECYNKYGKLMDMKDRASMKQIYIPHPRAPNG